MSEQYYVTINGGPLLNVTDQIETLRGARRTPGPATSAMLRFARLLLERPKLISFIGGASQELQAFLDEWPDESKKEMP